MRSLALTMLVFLVTLSAGAFGADEPDDAPRLTPPRLAYVDGVASFRRAGDAEWVPARVNTPLAAGDALYAADRTTFEVQIGSRAFVRAGERTHVRVVSLEPDFLQLEVSAGTAAVDLRTVPPSYTVEVDTPNAVFTIEHQGYYRVGVSEGETRFVTRRSGRASVSAGDAPAVAVTPSEEIVVRGTGTPTVASYAAPELDAWDRWNYARTEYEIDALSRRYVAPDVYGAADLDSYGTWRVVPPYGSVWVPYGVAAGWAPYTTGTWIYDPIYAWTWLDDAPWGWAPFHYGRWIYLDGYWGWAPGPVALSALYAPALVAFYGVGGGIGIGLGIGWVALAWGEPVHPWWGRPGHVGVPTWRGWAGPHVPVRGPIDYRNRHAPRAFVAMDAQRFGREFARGAPYREGGREASRPLDGALPGAPEGRRFGAPAARTILPPAASLPRAPAAPRESGALPRAEPAAPLPRPDLGAQGRERALRALPPRYESRGEATPRRAEVPRALSQPPRALPGRPANAIAPRAPGAGVPRPSAAPGAPGARAHPAPQGGARPQGSGPHRGR